MPKTTGVTIATSVEKWSDAAEAYVKHPSTSRRPLGVILVAYCLARFGSSPSVTPSLEKYPTA